MKKRIAVLCVISMLVSLVTMPVSACDDCKVLCDENYETLSSPGYTPNKADYVDESVIATVDSSDYVYYGLDNKVAELRSNTNKHNGINTKFEKSQNIKSGLYTGAGYTVDMSFDIRLSESGNKMRVLAEGSAGFDASNNVMGIEITADKEIIYYGRNTTTVVERKSLDTFFDTEKLDENHFYRIRFVLYVNNAEGTPVNYCDVYVDGYKVFENKEYAQNNKQKFICALSVAPSVDADGVMNIGMVDNLNVVSYGADNKPDFDAKAQKDNLLANIRTAGVVLKNEEISEDKKAVLTTAIQTAADKYSSDETDFSEAIANLKAAVEEAEKSTEIPEGPTDPEPELPDEPDEPEEEFSYIIKNDFETESKTPFTSVDMPIVEDNTAFINKAWKMTGKMNLLSDVFEETNILNSSTEPKGSDNIVEFDIKFDNLCETNANFSITHLYDQTPDGTQISCLTFQKGNINKMDGGGKTETTIGTNIFEDDVWYRVRIVQHMVNEDGTFPQDMSLYIDGKPVMEHFARRSRTATKAKLFNQLKLTGLGDDIIAYVDNFEIYKVADSIKNQPLDLGKNMRVIRNMQKFLSEATVGDNFGEYDAEDYNNVKNAYDTAVAEIPLMTNQAEADTQAEGLENLFGAVKPNKGKIWVDSVSYSSDNISEASSIDTDITVLTSRLADNSNDVLALSVLYRNSELYPGGEMLAVAAESVSLGTKATAVLKTSLDLSAYTERESLFVKTYVLTGENRTTELSFDNAILGNSDENKSVIDEIYDENADVFKKTINNEAYYSFSAKTEQNDRILIFVTKNDGTEIDLIDIDKNNADDKLAYFNIADVNKQGEINIRFRPDAEGTYSVNAYSGLKGVIYDSPSVYLNNTALDQLLTELKNGTVSIENVKEKLDLNKPLFDSCKAQGIALNEITREIFASNSNVDSFNFKTQYVKYMNLLCAVKTASTLDAVVKALTDYGCKNTNDPYLWNSICEYVYVNRNSVVSPYALNQLLAYTPAVSTPSSGSNTSSGGGGGGGGRGGYATTSTGSTSTVQAQTPYEKNAFIFNDIAGVSWAEEAIIFLARNNIVSGKADGVFAPDDKITREEFAKIIVNTFGSGAESEIPYFADVDTNSWYYPYIVKIYSDGLAKGIGDNTFGVGMEISREDAIVMLYRAGNLKGASYSDKAEFIPFEDDCSSYAQEAVEAFAKSGIISGTGNNMLNAGKSLTRAEAAKMVYGLYTFINQSSAN